MVRGLLPYLYNPTQTTAAFLRRLSVVVFALKNMQSTAVWASPLPVVFLSRLLPVLWLLSLLLKGSLLVFCVSTLNSLLYQ